MNPVLSSECTLFDSPLRVRLFLMKFYLVYTQSLHATYSTVPQKAYYRFISTSIYLSIYSCCSPWSTGHP
jgi:hypothetical protein